MLVDCTRLSLATIFLFPNNLLGNRGCSGGSITRTYNFIEQFGVTVDSDYRPYEAANGTCEYTPDDVTMQRIDGFEQLFTGQEILDRLY